MRRIAPRVPVVYTSFLPGWVPRRVAHRERVTVLRTTLLACRCEWPRREEYAAEVGADLFPVECRGVRSLGMIADVVLGIRRAHLDYGELPLSREQILEPAPRWGAGGGAA